MGINLRNVKPGSPLRKYVHSLEIVQMESAGDGASYGVPADLSSGFTASFMVPGACRFVKHTWVHDADFTGSTGMTVNISSPDTSQSMIALQNVWSASQQDAGNSSILPEGMFSGSDWSGNRPVSKVVDPGCAFLSAGSIVTVTVSALSCTKSLIYGTLEFEYDVREQV